MEIERATRSLKTTIAANIRFAQEKHGLNTEELARKLNVTPRLVHKWRRGDHAPSLSNMERLAEVLGYPSEWFFSQNVGEV